MTLLPPQSDPCTETGGILRAGAICFVLLFGAIGGWASFATISGAVIATGHVLVQGKTQPVQSLDGGLVATVHVVNGDHVAAGDVIASLDRAIAATRLDITRGRLAEALALRARLMAESTGKPVLRLDPPDLPFLLPDMEGALASQRALLEARTARQADGRDRLAETSAQIAAQIAGITAQEQAAQTEAALIDQEIGTMTTLLDKGLARQTAFADLRREEAALTGRLASLNFERDRLAGSAREAALALRQEEGARKEDVAQELRDTSALIAELIQQGIGHDAQLARTDLRAPVSGVVHELAVTAAGAVLAPGAGLAQIVPVQRGIEIEVRVDPRAIDQVWQGQTADVSISALDPRATPRLRAEVAVVPPAAVTDPGTGHSFFRVTLRLPDTEIARLDGGILTPGMPVEAFLATGQRSVLSWLIAPIMAPLNRALREN
jgi:HlyD family secretion protein